MVDYQTHNSFMKKFERNKKPHTKKETTSWGAVSEWYNNTLETDTDSYQSKVILPNVLRLLSPVQGKKILDLACGQGFFSRALEQQGALVTGVDISPELIAQARKLSPPSINYFVSSAHVLKNIANKSQDAVVCVLALQNIEQVPEVCKEVVRVLKEGGSFYFVLNHPSFRIPQASDWGFDPKKNIQYRRVEKYLHEAKIRIDMTPGKRTDKIFTLSFHRPLQYFVKALKNAGFMIANMEEWESHKMSGNGPRKMAEDKARKEIPLFLFVQAVQSAHTNK